MKTRDQLLDTFHYEQAQEREKDREYKENRFRLLLICLSALIFTDVEWEIFPHTDDENITIKWWCKENSCQRFIATSMGRLQFVTVMNDIMRLRREEESKKEKEKLLAHRKAAALARIPIEDRKLLGL